MKLLIVACVLILATTVLAGCGGLSPRQRMARREATQLVTYLHLGSAHPTIKSIDIRGGNFAVIVLQGHFEVPISCPALPGTSCAGSSLARRAQLGFALRDPKHHWRMAYDFGHGF